VLEEVPKPSVPAAIGIAMPTQVAARRASAPYWEGRMMLGLLAVAVGGSVHRRRTGRP
jgi:hypothetical protein